MIKVLQCFLILIFPNIVFASKPDDPTVRVGATIFMVLLVAVIGVAWRAAKSKLDKRNAESIHKTHESRKPIPDYSPPVPVSASKAETPPQQIAPPKNQPSQRPSKTAVTTSRNTLSLEEAVLGHWVSYIDFRTSYEKMKRTDHYVATNWYIGENKLKIVQLEIKGSTQVPKVTRTMTFNILDRSESKRMLRFEMFDEPSKKDYWQGTFRLGADNLTMLHDEVIPRFSKETTKWNYVDSTRP